MSTPILSAMMEAGVSLEDLGNSTQVPADAKAPPAVKEAAVEQASKPDLSAEKPAAPKYLNVYAKRAEKAAGAKVAPAASTPAPTTPAAAPAVDPRIASMEAEVAALRGLASAQAERELRQLPEGVQKYVEKAAGDSAARRLEVIQALRDNGVISAPPSVPAGATTIPLAPAPPRSVPDHDEVVLNEYERLAGRSPILAAEFLRTNPDSIYRAQAARASRN